MGRRGRGREVREGGLNPTVQARPGECSMGRIEPGFLGGFAPSERSLKRRAGGIRRRARMTALIANAKPCSRPWCGPEQKARPIC